MQLHVCPEDFSHQPTWGNVLRASGYWIVDEDRLPRQTLLETVDDVDELAGSRHLLSPSASSENKKKQKNNKKGKGKSKKEEKERGAKKGDDQETCLSVWCWDACIES